MHRFESLPRLGTGLPGPQLFHEPGEVRTGFAAEVVRVVMDREPLTTQEQQGYFVPGLRVARRRTRQ
jgi:hypothetical protein